MHESFAAGSPDELWAAVALQVRRWLDARGIPVLDACVLLPFVELLAPAKRAFAATGGWLPRVHTTQTLAGELAPPAAPAASGPTGDVTIDGLLAGQLLRQQAWGRDWLQRDPGAFNHAVNRIVRTAHALLRGAQAAGPSGRAAFWARARDIAAPGAGIDRGLLRATIVWSALADAVPTDVLFAHRPTAWVIVQFGGDDALALSLSRDAVVPSLILTLDAGAADPFEELPGSGSIELLCAADGEVEAQAAACEVVAALDRGEGPVALVAEDRALVRRVRALLERTGTAVADETGWPLSTTRAGARAMAALRAAHPAATPDDVLDWLKSAVAHDDPTAVAALEMSWRHRQRQRHRDADAAEAMWAREQSRLRLFAETRRRPLAAWLQAFDSLLFGAHDDPVVAEPADEALRQLRQALWLDGEARIQPAQAWLDTMMTLEAFTAWVQQGLEEARFVPETAGDAAAVVITPLSRAIGRPFGTVVVPGTDAQRLALNESPDLLLGDAALRELGLPDLASRRRRQAQAFVHLMRSSRVVLLWRQADGDELLAPSALVDRLREACAATGRPILEREATVPMRCVAVQPTAVPTPTAGQRLPRTWSASAVESLRQCPYQFFARAVLGLREDDELDDDVDKRDFGTWLHAALERFHAARAAPATEAEDMAQLLRAAQEALDALAGDGAFDTSAMLPYTAGLEPFAVRYVRWLRAHEQAGWRYAAGEVEYTVPIEDADGGEGAARLRGRIDRIDRHAGQAAAQVIDYKTGAADALKRRVREPLEDVQLAVYAALMQPTLPEGTTLSAAYLALDDSDGIVEIAHPNVADTACMLRQGLADDRRRMLAGTPLPPLGQGSACDHCEARGLCRRDHWARAVLA